MPEPLILLHGDDSYLVTEAARRLRAELCQNLISDLGFEEFKGSADLEALERSLATPPFLAIRRVVLVWDPPQIAAGKRSGKDAELLLKVLGARAETTATCVVVRSALTPASTLVKGVRALGGEPRLVARPKGRELRRYVEERVAARRLRLHRSTIQLLVEVATRDLGWLETELEKLDLYRSDGQPLEEEAGLAIVTSAPPTELYRLTDCLFEHPAAVGGRLHSVLARPDVRPEAVVGALARSLRDLITYSDPAESERRGTLPSWRLEGLARHLRAAGKEQLAEWLVALGDLDWGVRSGAVDATEGLELLLAAIASAVLDHRAH